MVAVSTRWEAFVRSFLTVLFLFYLMADGVLLVLVFTWGFFQ